MFMVKILCPGRSSNSLLEFGESCVSALASCNGVPDFERCSGDTEDFCPRGIDCSCKAGHAFCSCPYYQGPNADFWYLGKKCDQLWSTLDLIAITVLPGVALAFIVAVTAQLIHYCKTKPRSRPKTENRSEREHQTVHSHQNPSFQSEADPRYVDVPLVNVPSPAAQKLQGSAAWSAPEQQNPPRKLNYYSETPPDHHFSNHVKPKPQQAQNFAGPSFRYPQQDYDASEQRPTNQFPRGGVRVLPQADYSWGRPEPSSPNTNWTEESFSFRRPQLNTDYQR
ncbi:uncharacterized protein [Hyperolius riggenbachi]|uniref:uncharacterized protein n=1 Tax=Hyperolius riggenbachi TaxID=752182 RepID=UPI0035A31DD0